MIVSGPVASLPMDNVDTDQIIPARYLTTVSREGLGEGLFADLGVTLPAAPILAAGRNFGTGSSREHAVWALMAAGFRCVLASSFADIFYGNALKNGLLPVVLEPAALARAGGATATVCLATQRVSLEDGTSWEFCIEPFRKRCLLCGRDDLGYLMSHMDAISAFEERRLRASA